MHRSPAVGYEDITTIERLPAPYPISVDGAPGFAYVMPGKFRLLLAGHNVAGIAGDVIVTGMHVELGEDGKERMVEYAWVVFHGQWDEKRYPKRDA